MAAIKAYAKQHDIRIVKVFREEGVTGTKETMDRPAWVEMLTGCNGVRTIIIERAAILPDAGCAERMVAALGSRLHPTVRGESFGHQERREGPDPMTARQPGEGRQCAKSARKRGRCGERQRNHRLPSSYSNQHRTPLTDQNQFAVSGRIMWINSFGNECGVKVENATTD